MFRKRQNVLLGAHLAVKLQGNRLHTASLKELHATKVPFWHEVHGLQTPLEVWLNPKRNCPAGQTVKGRHAEFAVLVHALKKEVVLQDRTVHGEHARFCCSTPVQFRSKKKSGAHWLGCVQPVHTWSTRSCVPVHTVERYCPGLQRLEQFAQDIFLNAEQVLTIKLPLPQEVPQAPHTLFCVIVQFCVANVLLGQVWHVWHAVWLRVDRNVPAGQATQASPCLRYPMLHSNGQELGDVARVVVLVKYEFDTTVHARHLCAVDKLL